MGDLGATLLQNELHLVEGASVNEGGMTAFNPYDLLRGVGSRCAGGLVLAVPDQRAGVDFVLQDVVDGVLGPGLSLYSCDPLAVQSLGDLLGRHAIDRHSEHAPNGCELIRRTGFAEALPAARPPT